jgi:hypothetical protein
MAALQLLKKYLSSTLLLATTTLNLTAYFMPFLYSNDADYKRITVKEYFHLVNNGNEQCLGPSFYSFLAFFFILTVMNVVVLAAKTYFNVTNRHEDLSNYFVGICVTTMAPVLSSTFLIKNAYECIPFTITGLGPVVYLLDASLITSFFAAFAERFLACKSKVKAEETCIIDGKV